MSEITFKQAISDALAEEMRRDDKVFMMGEELGPYNGCFGVTKGSSMNSVLTGLWIHLFPKVDLQEWP